ncbi:hypothetical protein [Paraglaciecola sp. MB-3u-78]|uniref:hypothetical protein n=1 Tax=Paraglaciecola sp. MB-3u-78 TaxID=2058332 RepID=UPI000C34DFC1|nr:hypothetical protein [Paraglaciecola sp. MB-3u-78]PKH00966.1 hypothetical protein CXF95_01825 [Paraglaciecola sp. MB-3u-78]
MNKNKILSVFLGLVSISLIGIVWLNFLPTTNQVDQKIAPKTVSISSQSQPDVKLNAQNFTNGIVNENADSKKSAFIQSQSLESSKQFIDDAKLIAEIEKEMGFLPRPEGDLSYMSPENETIQPEFVDFPVLEPEDVNATLGEAVSGPEKIGTPYKEDVGS